MEILKKMFAFREYVQHCEIHIQRLMKLRIRIRLAALSFRFFGGYRKVPFIFLL